MRSLTFARVVAALLSSVAGFAGHRDAPGTAIDQAANITDVFAFRSYDNASPPRVTLIMCVNPWLHAANGPVWSPFDTDVLYEIKIDNNNDASADIVFQFRFSTEQRLPNLFQVVAGVRTGVVAPANSPPPVPTGTPILPPRITSFGDVGLGQRQSYTVNIVRNGASTPLTAPGPLYAVPADAGPRTMDYNALFSAAVYSLPSNVRVFAGTTDDPFFADLGGLSDTFNTHAGLVLNLGQDNAPRNFGPDTLARHAVNAIAIEVPVSMLTRTGNVEPANSAAATIGVWASTSRRRVIVRGAPMPSTTAGSFTQVDRAGNPLVNHLLIGTGYKDRFSMDQPRNDSQFASFFLDPAIARVLNALTGGEVAIPTPPRLDLLPFWTYASPIAASGTTAGPIANLLRLNTGVPPTRLPEASRLGILGGDAAGFPNGRRLFDDVLDISLRVWVGALMARFSTSPINTRLGDGVNVNDVPFRTTFPYLANCPSGRTAQD
jgi:hypothetical protein